MDTATVTRTGTRDSAAALGLGLLWGGAMLVVLAVWLAIKDGAAGPLSFLVGFVGVVGLGLALMPLATLWQRLSPEEQARRIGIQRLLVGRALLGGGLLFLVLALVLGLTRKPEATLGVGLALDNFGPAGGLFLFAVITLIAGSTLLLPQGASSATALEGVRRKLPLLKMLLAGVGIALLGFFAYLGFYLKVGSEVYPELIALILLSALCFTTIISLGYTPAEQIELTYLRAVILIFGGGAGLVLFLMTIGRAWLWRNDIFMGGMTAWQGDNAWRLWLVIYLQLAGLLLVFGSFGLAQADVRSSVTLRRVLYGYNTFFQSLLVLELLIVMIVVVYALAPFTFQWSKSRGLYALSPASQNLLGSLKQDAHAFVLMSPGSSTYHDLKLLMDNAQMQSNKFEVKYVSPDRDVVEYDRLAKVFPKILPDVKLARGDDSGRGVLLVYGPMPQSDDHDVKYAFIAERKLTEQKMDMAHRNPTRVFNGELELMRELNFLVQGQQKRKVYVLQGAGLPDLAETLPSGRRDVTFGFSKIGIGVVADKLRKENYDVHGLSFELELVGKKEALTYAKESSDKTKDVPDDAYAVVVAGASKPLATEVVDGVTRYIDRGGRLIVFLDVITDDSYSELKSTGLEPLLKRYGVEVEDKYALLVPPDPRMLGRVDLATLPASAPRNATNPIAKQFWRGRFAIDMRNTARILKPGVGGAFKVEPLLQLDKDVVEEFFLTESSPAALRDPTRFEIDLWNDRSIRTRVATEPLNVAVAVSETKNDKPRLIVFGDTDFITNFDVSRSPRDQNFALVQSGLEWMAEREGFIGPRPKETTLYALPVAERQDALSRMVHIPGWLMLLTLLGLGTGIWLVRRR
jgi:hypothetical protein